MLESLQASLASIPRMGWIDAPSPLESHAELAKELGLSRLWIKRDDRLRAFGGGSKVRKLDLIAAQPLYREAQTWHTSGAIGSGHLVACARACRSTSRKLIAHCSDQPISQGVVENLARTAEAAHELQYYPSRAAMALRKPQLLLASSWRGEAIVPPGGTCPAGTSGFVLAALELVEQLRALDAPPPERIYLPLGSGGAALGLALGLALAGLDTRVHAVSVVERWLIPPLRLSALERSTLRWLHSLAAEIPRRLRTRLELDTSQVGRGYAHPSPASRAATRRLTRAGVPLEPVYSGKAMAALMRDARELRARSILFWLTCHGIAHGPPAPGWRQGLPRALRQRLESDPGYS